MGKPYQNFLDRLDSKEPQTKAVYIKYFRYYLQFLKVKDPNSLIVKKVYSPLEVQKIENKIMDYINHLKKQKLSQIQLKVGIFYLIMYHANELDDSHMYLNKIYTSYIFFLKAKADDIINTVDSLRIKKLVVVGGIFS